jgi:hypothetical protein
MLPHLHVLTHSAPLSLSTIAKRAYLHTLMSPPPSLMTSTGVPAKIRPYDGDDASMIISSVQNRPRSRSNAGSQAAPAYGGSVAEEVLATPPRNVMAGSPRSIGRSLGSGHRRNPSGSNPSSLPAKPLAAALFDAANGGPSPAHHLANAVAAEAAAAAATASASPSDSGPSSPSYSHNGGNQATSAALKSLPMNPMTAPRSSALGLEVSPERKAAGSESNGGGSAAGASSARVV